jgi:thioredoxin reductase
MTSGTDYEVIIIGGSYAGLSAALALGRSLRKVLIIDSGRPCNQQTPHSHNFITQDGETPSAIADKARVQVLKYETVKLIEGLAIEAKRIDEGFEIKTQQGDIFRAKKLLLATGITDIMPQIKGFAACWGISVLHCPYCHGYEVKHQPIGILANGDIGFEFSKLINQWSKELTLFTNGKSTLTNEQTARLQSRNINIIENEIAALEHVGGYIQQIAFKDQSERQVTALFARVDFRQHCDLAEQMGCELTAQGHVQTDDFCRTNIPGVYVAGDSGSMLRAVSAAVSAGTKAGAFINKELIEEAF